MGGPRSIAIEGEPGIGKTRLLAELQARAASRHHIVLHGRATEFDRDVPFAVVVDAVDAYLASHRPAEIQAWDEEVVNEIAGIFPSLRRLAPNARGGLSEERYRAHRAIRWMLERLAVARGLVVALPVGGVFGSQDPWASQASSSNGVRRCRRSRATCMCFPTDSISSNGTMPTSAPGQS